MKKKWRINLNEELDMINATLDIGSSLRQIIIGIRLFLAFHAIRKSLKCVKFRLAPKQNLFMLLPVLRMVILASVELSGELMQEIHQI